MALILCSWAPTLSAGFIRRVGVVVEMWFFFFRLIVFFSFSKTVFTSDTSLWILLLSNSYYGYTSSFDLSKKAKPNQDKKQSLSSRRVYFYIIFFKLASINSGLNSSDISKLFFFPSDKHILRGFVSAWRLIHLGLITADSSGCQL